MKFRTLRELLDDYKLCRDLRPSSEAYYLRVVKVLESWHGGPMKIKDFTIDNVNRFLGDKRDAGKSSHYRKSLRNALRALFNHAGIVGKLRPVKFESLDPQVWTAEQVERLMQVAPTQLWRLRIAVAYYTGLNQVDLEQIEKKDIVDGVLRWRRSKTRKLVVVAFPQWLLDMLPDEGPLVPTRVTGEWLRRQFRIMVAKAGLTGTFKTLRKTSGTLVESLNPGAGHLHLGNTRAVFEKHYMNPERALVPMMPDPLKREAVEV